MDIIDFSRYFAALLIVLGLLGGFAVILRRGWIPGVAAGLPTFSKARSERRLALCESLILDPRRRVMIVAVDDREHVILLGAAGETLLESRPAKPAFEPVPPSEAEAEPRLVSGDGR